MAQNTGMSIGRNYIRPCRRPKNAPLAQILIESFPKVPRPYLMHCAILTKGQGIDYFEKS